jgi:hypothetical protein
LSHHEKRSSLRSCAEGHRHEPDGSWKRAAAAGDKFLFIIVAIPIVVAIFTTEVALLLQPPRLFKPGFPAIEQRLGTLPFRFA